MNIFVTDTCPYKSAVALDDRRLNKMIIESCQMLATAMLKRGVQQNLLPTTKAGTPFKATHVNHPCTVWAGRTQGNFRWLLDHMIGLSREYTHRFDRTHACSMNISLIQNAIEKMPPGALEPFQNSSLFKDNPDVIQAYRDTLGHKWMVLDKDARWTRAMPPEWWNPQVEPIEEDTKDERIVVPS